MTSEERQMHRLLLHYEMANGWIMVLSWIPLLPEWVCKAIASHYVRKADRKARRMHQGRVEEFLKKGS